MSWFKDGVKVAEDANISLVQDKDHYRLVLVNTSPEDNGEYKVMYFSHKICTFEKKLFFVIHDFPWNHLNRVVQPIKNFILN